MYHDFLGESEDIVLIQLFRDPRAVVNSRHRTGWYTSMYKDYQSMTEDVQCLCSRMYADYKYGLEYQENYPGKFMFVVYEDLLSDLPKKLDQLYRKLGMDTLDELSNSSGEFQKLVGLHKTNKTENRTKRKDYEFWWRSSLTWATVQTIDRSCRDIYQAIGYKSFTNEKQFRNYAIPSVELKDGLKI